MISPVTISVFKLFATLQVFAHGVTVITEFPNCLQFGLALLLRSNDSICRWVEAHFPKERK